MDVYYWYGQGHVFVQDIAVGMSGTRPQQNYSYKTDFENKRINQDFWRQNISMSRLPLESTTIGTDTTNITTSPI